MKMNSLTIPPSVPCAYRILTATLILIRMAMIPIGAVIQILPLALTKKLEPTLN